MAKKKTAAEAALTNGTPPADEPVHEPIFVDEPPAVYPVAKNPVDEIEKLTKQRCKLIDQCDKAQRKMIRAFKRWEKLKKAERRNILRLLRLGVQ